MNHKVKTQFTPFMGGMFLGMGVFAGLSFGAIFLVVFLRAPELVSTPMMIAMIAAVTIGILPPIIMGIVFLSKGLASKRVMKEGKKSKGTIRNIVGVRNGYQMAVAYTDDFGEERILCVGVNYTLAAAFQPGTRIEIYVKGTDAYLDTKNIVEIKEEDDRW